MTSDEAEETVVLSRRDRRRAEADADAVPESSVSEVDESTVVVDRSATSAEEVPDEATIVVDRSADSAEDQADESTVVVDRSAGSTADASGEATIVVSRPDRRLRRKRAQTTGSADSTTTEVSAPSREAEPFAPPTNGPAPAIYKPRPAPLAPVAPPVVVGAAAPTRVENPGLPSVARQGRRWSMLTLGAAAGACVVSVTGLIVLGFVVIG
ncbi:hypothetical protein ACIPV2_07750 [Microbacterium sp. NPDC089987]|uniref:hypothetical protein n=1 Tax=Microbacterium sp. NPDC089987 TaxID=3364202 RepID=UPI0038100E7A